MVSISVVGGDDVEVGGMSLEEVEVEIEAASTSRQSSSTSAMLPRAGAIECHCRLNQLATSLCEPESQGSRRMLCHLRGEFDEEDGRGICRSQVVSAFTTFLVSFDQAR